MLQLNNITLVCIDCKNHASAIKAILKSTEQIKFGEVLFLSDKNFFNENFKTIIINTISSKDEYSKFMLCELHKYIETDFVLIIQYDGYIINPELWDNNWLNYDYLGAPWWYNDGFNVGNGGFSLRSKRLLNASYEITLPMLLKGLDEKEDYIVHPEDDYLCRKQREYLEKFYNITFPSENIASKFSYEPNPKYPVFKNDTFGFHGLPKLIL